MTARGTLLSRAGRAAVLCGVIALLALSGPRTAAQEPTTRYFEETGHNVSGEFAQFYDQHGGRTIFGYPLTREFSENGRTVQYFQRVRMELHPENLDPYKVQLGLLGDELGYRTPPILESAIPPAGHPDKRYFAETGHTVSFAFLDFYDHQGGLDVFGYPITEWIIQENGRIVQYFQRGKMEWYPENPPGQRVQLGMLGALYVEKAVDPIYTQREDPQVEPEPAQPADEEAARIVSRSDVIGMRATVTLKHAVIGLNQTQTAYVYLFDQNSQGLPGVPVEVEVQYQDGQVDRFSAQTNGNGYCQVDFDIAKSAPGYVVIVHLNASYQGIETKANAAFLPWW
jgi:hypothetical protein